MKRSLPVLVLVISLVAATAGDALAQNPIPPPRPPVTRATPPPASTPAAETSAPPAAFSSSGAPPAAVTNAPASGDYVLAPSDAVEMTVFKQPDLTTQAKVSNDGSVQFPLIGELKIGGLTLRDARELICKRYNADYLVEPQVYLNVIAYAQHKITILGQVNTPGTFVMPGGEHLGLLQAIGMAGGFTRLADRGAVVVKRTRNGEDETIKLNAKRLTDKNGKQFELEAGDVITVGESWF